MADFDPMPTAARPPEEDVGDESWLPIEMWGAVASFVADDDLYFFAAACRLLHAAAVDVARRRLRTSWRACLASETRLAWARAPPPKGAAAPTDVFRLALIEDLYIESCRRGREGMAAGLLEEVVSDGADCAELRVHALLAAAGAPEGRATAAEKEGRSRMCRALWAAVQEDLGLTIGSWCVAYAALAASAYANRVDEIRFFMDEFDQKTDYAEESYDMSTEVAQFSRSIHRMRYGLSETLSMFVALDADCYEGGRIGAYKSLYAELSARAPTHRAAMSAMAPRVADVSLKSSWRIARDLGAAVVTDALRRTLGQAQKLLSYYALSRTENHVAATQHAILLAAVDVDGVRPFDSGAGAGKVHIDESAISKCGSEYEDLRAAALDSCLSVETCLADVFVVRELSGAVRSELACRAAARGNVELCEHLVEVGDSIRTDLRAKAFAAAASAGRLDVCRSLYENKPSVLSSGAGVFAEAPERVRRWGADAIAKLGPKYRTQALTSWFMGVRSVAAARWALDWGVADDAHDARFQVIRLVADKKVSHQEVAEIWAVLGCGKLSLGAVLMALKSAVTAGRVDMCDWICELYFMPECAHREVVERSLDLIRGCVDAGDAVRAWVGRICDARNRSELSQNQYSIGLLIRQSARDAFSGRLPDTTQRSDSYRWLQMSVTLALARGHPRAVDWLRENFGFTRQSFEICDIRLQLGPKAVIGSARGAISLQSRSARYVDRIFGAKA